MMAIQDGLYVRIEEMAGDLAPNPKPLAHGFNKATAYRVLGGFSLAESADAFLILSNDRDEIWFISNRHLRTHALRPGTTEFRIPLREGDRSIADKTPAAVAHGNGNGRRPNGARR
ncbi:MAG: hypothetical protein M3Y86_03100 [Verrucomicrobiota bacterium]|nr:hypothetical protein [Verrucomicrobiota bacterium]